MYIELLTLGGYGQFVWPAFIFTFVCFLSLYLKTKRELVKQEKLFLKENRQVTTTKIRATKQKRILKEISTVNLI
tara:strand:+ start:542 stop:766 length:225 start_codon:yes stop_codon:yes gene_type:complete